MSDTKSKLTVINCKEAKPGPVNEELVLMLEGLIDRVKAGEVIGIVGMMTYDGGDCEQFYSSGQDVLRAIGMVRVLMRDLEDVYMGDD